MREFGKTERKPRWRKILDFFLSFVFTNEQQSFMGHEDRMRARRRKTRFDR